MKEAPNWPIDGGRRAWMSLFGAFWGIFIAFGWLNSLGVFQSYYEQNLLENYSPSTISWIASVQESLIYMAGFVFGKMYDDYGPRWLLIIGGIAQVFGLMMTSISTKYYQIFLAQAICSALGASAVFYAALGALATWWKTRRALAFGIATSGSSIGGIVFPVMANRLIPQVGFGWTMRAVAFIGLLGVVMMAVTLRSNRAHIPTPFSIQAYIAPMKDKRFVLLCLALTLFGFGLFLPLNFIPSAALSLGMSWELSVYTVCVMNGASIFGRIAPGYLADIFGRFNTMMICTLITAIITLGLWLPGHNNAATICFAAFFGFFSGCYVSMTPALVADVSPPQEVGHRIGMLYFCISFGVLTGSPIAGALVDADGGQYTYLKIFAGATMLAGAVVISVLRFYMDHLAKQTKGERVDAMTEESKV